MVISTRFPYALAILFAGIPVYALGQEGMESTKKYQILFETTEHRIYCKASVWVEYSQYDTEAHYNGEISNEECGPSSGTYTIAVRYRDESGQVHATEIENIWQRADDRTVIIEGKHSIGANVDLIRVRARKIQCVCANNESPTTEITETGENK